MIMSSLASKLRQTLNQQPVPLQDVVQHPGVLQASKYQTSDRAPLNTALIPTSFASTLSQSSSSSSPSSSSSSTTSASKSQSLDNGLTKHLNSNHTSGSTNCISIKSTNQKSINQKLDANFDQQSDQTSSSDANGRNASTAPKMQWSSLAKILMFNQSNQTVPVENGDCAIIDHQHPDGAGDTNQSAPPVGSRWQCNLNLNLNLNSNSDSNSNPNSNPNPNLNLIESVRVRLHSRLSAFLVLVCIACSTCVWYQNTFVSRLSRPASSGVLPRLADPTSAGSELTLDQLSEFEQALSVRTDCGWLVGNIEQGAFVFKGIEYGVAERWRKAIAIWTEPKFCDAEKVHRAAQFGQICAQFHPLRGNTYGSERCLYLNVWTPRLDLTAQLPVLVWLHAGFGQFGSGHEYYQRPSGLLARKLNAVLVTINYRLDAFAFATNQNLAISDQLVALDWVQRHIDKFGGSSRRVTLAGADGGAACALAMLTSGQLTNRISRLWLTGPAVYHPNDAQHNLSPSAVSSFTSGLNGSKSNGNQANEMQWITIEPQLQIAQILRSYLGSSGEPSFRINDQNDLPIQGIFTPQWIKMDGQLVQEAYPFNASNQSFSQIPILIGTSMHAIEYWPGPRDLHNWTWPAYIKYVVTSLDSFSTHTSATALKLYPPGHNETNHNVSTDAIDTLDHKYKLKEFTVDHTHAKSASASDTLNQLTDSHSIKHPDANGDHMYQGQRTGSTLDDPKMKTHQQVNADELYATMVSDIRQTCPINQVASNLAKHHSMPVYRYVVSAKPSKPIQLYDYASRNSFHLFEVIAFFDRLAHLVDVPSEKDVLFAQRVQQLVADFIHSPVQSLIDTHPHTSAKHKHSEKTGSDWRPSTNQSRSVSDQSTSGAHPHPKLGEDGLWPRYPDSIALLDYDITLVNSYASARCAFWTQHSLDRYAWIC